MNFLYDEIVKCNNSLNIRLNAFIANYPLKYTIFDIIEKLPLLNQDMAYLINPFFVDDWACLDYEDGEGFNLIDKFISRMEDRLTKLELKLLKGRRKSSLSLYRFLGYGSDSHINIRDLIRQEDYLVLSYDLARLIKPGDVFISRLVNLDGKKVFLEPKLVQVKDPSLILRAFIKDLNLESLDLDSYLKLYGIRLLEMINDYDPQDLDLESLIFDLFNEIPNYEDFFNLSRPIESLDLLENIFYPSLDIDKRNEDFSLISLELAKVFSYLEYKSIDRDFLELGDNLSSFLQANIELIKEDIRLLNDLDLREYFSSLREAGLIYSQEELFIYLRDLGYYGQTKLEEGIDLREFTDKVDYYLINRFELAKVFNKTSFPLAIDPFIFSFLEENPRREYLDLSLALKEVLSLVADSALSLTKIRRQLSKSSLRLVEERMIELASISSFYFDGNSYLEELVKLVLNFFLEEELIGLDRETNIFYLKDRAKDFSSLKASYQSSYFIQESLASYFLNPDREKEPFFLYFLSYLGLAYKDYLYELNPKGRDIKARLLGSYQADLLRIRR